MLIFSLLQFTLNTFLARDYELAAHKKYANIAGIRDIC